jgi:hypothetical protein
MNKKVNPKYILLVLVILLIIDFSTTSFGLGTWNLNRTIGWGNQNLNISLLNPLIAHTIFALVYIFLFARRKSVLVFLASLQLSIVVADIIIRSTYSYNPFYLLVISNWILMTLVIIFAYREKALE